MGITHGPEQHAQGKAFPEKEFCWVAPVKRFQKNVIVWVPFLSKVLSCCSLDFPGRHISDSELHPCSRSRTSPAVPRARPAPDMSQFLQGLRARVMLCETPRQDVAVVPCWALCCGGCFAALIFSSQLCLALSIFH